MSRKLISIAVLLMFIGGGCGEHIPTETDGPTSPTGDFGQEQFIQGPSYFDSMGMQTFLLQSDRIISVLFDSTAPNTQLRQVASAFNLLLYPDLTRPAEVDWETEKRRTSLWVVPEGSAITDYFTIFPRTENNTSLFGLHPLIRKSFPSYADPELETRYFVDDRFTVRTTPEVTRNDLSQYNEFNGVEIVDVRTFPDINIREFMLRLTGNARLGTIDMANEYRGIIFIESSFPDFIAMEMN
jgi:hypothetical protein